LSQEEEKVDENVALAVMRRLSLSPEKA